MENAAIDAIIEAALKEDLPHGDITSESIIPARSKSEAIILTKEEGVLAGIDVARRVFYKIDQSISFKKNLDDGQIFRKKDTIATLRGPSISLLKSERTALNFLQRMSGIATTTRRFVQVLEGTQTKILDTRKTTPGLRLLEKYAVKIGGGVNHRFDLSEMVLIKDNHLKLVGSILQAVMRAKEKVKPGVRIEVEATNLEEVQEAVRSGANVVMLDNMSIKNMKEVVKWIKGKIPLEVSGKVTLGRIVEIASLGVDYISVGSLTHSYKSVDMSIEFLR
jgi:nicotinate-nucleotide pyrophosphorylase (carboxylating)